MAQVANTMNGSMPVTSAPAPLEDNSAPAVTVEAPAPARQIDNTALRNLGAKYKALFLRYQGERQPAEQKWLKNLRQYLGIYDPQIESQLTPDRSRAYPRFTRVKCISMLSRLMNLMFPGNEDNWELQASPSPEMDPNAVADAVKQLMDELQAGGSQVALDDDLVMQAVRKLADKQAAKLTTLVKDQLLELGGNQTRDWINLNRQVVDSGIKFGVGVLEGPFVRKIEQSGWIIQAQATQNPDGSMSPAGFKPMTRTIYKPQFEFLPVWDFYPDMSARELPGEGYFVRKVLGRAALRRLADRPDFFGSQVKQVLTQLPGGNFQAKSWETELRAMGLSEQTQQNSTQVSGREKYEVIIWKGPVSAQTLRECGVEVPDSMLADDVDAELWMIDNWIVKAEINAWRKLGVQMQTAHIFSFDEDDTSPIGQGLPGIVRDTQMSICAVTRMLLDNASVTCGPIMEVNTRLMQAGQDITSLHAYKIFYRDDDDPLTAQYPAVRAVQVDGHLAELEGLIKLFMEIGEMETFIGRATGGDMSQMPSEPMRTAAGASMLRGDAALPFKDIVRNYDTFTQSVIWSIVNFNRKFNPDQAAEGDYDVIPRGATSLIAKEVRGAQIDMLSQTLTPDERDHVDERKFVEAKFAARDMQGMLVSEDEAARRKDARAQQAAQQADQQNRMIEAQIRETAAQAFNKAAQGQRNAAGAQGVAVDSALKLATGVDNGDGQGASGATGGAGSQRRKTA